MGRPFYRVALKVCPHSVLTSLRDAGLVLRLMGRRAKGFGGWSRRFGGASRQSPKPKGPGPERKRRALRVGGITLEARVLGNHKIPHQRQARAWRPGREAR